MVRITLGMNVEDEARKTYAFVNELLENLPDMIFVKEAQELRFVRFNRAGEQLLGYSREELIGKNDYDFFGKEEADFFVSKDRAVLESGKLLDIPEEPIHTRHLGKRILHTKKIPIYDEHGKPQYLLGISEDITDRKRAEEDHERLLREQIARAESERAIQRRDEFIAIAAHELKTPLTALNIQLAMLERPEVRPEKYIEHVKVSKRQLERFSRMVDALLDVTQASSGKLVVTRCEVDFAELIRRVVEVETVELNRAGCQVTLNLPETILGFWDPLRLEQVVSNLVSNAAKYGRGKPIEIEAQIEGKAARLFVRDHGIGIDEPDLERIFSRFERAEAAKAFGGIGLGLFVSREIVVAHGGTIRVESKREQGACFIVELPLR